jgi:monothiol glutaredoxin
MPDNQPRSSQQWIEQFKKDISAHRVFLYAKGEKNAAACGFSHRVMEVFNRLGVDYGVRNILSDPAILDSLEEFTNWPTSPQVFIDGEFVGGCDIVTEMYETGELQERLGGKKPATRP